VLQRPELSDLSLLFVFWALDGLTINFRFTCVDVNLERLGVF